MRKITESGAVSSRVFGSTAFTDSIFKRVRTRAKGVKSASRKCASKPSAGEIMFEIYAADVRPDEVLCLVGESESLGAWSPERSLPLCDRDFPMWRISLPASELPDRFEYKFIVRKREDDGSTIWEEGYNRQFDYFKPATGEALQLEVRARAGLRRLVLGLHDGDLVVALRNRRESAVERIDRSCIEETLFHEFIPFLVVLLTGAVVRPSGSTVRASTSFLGRRCA